MAVVSVLAPSRYPPRGIDGDFALMWDRWDDFGFKTQYQLYIVRQNGEIELIGSVKILQRGQTTSFGPMLEGNFDQLSDDWVSVGESLDYYQRLNELPIEDRNRILTALRDVILDPQRRDSFQDEEGWKTSLFRGSSSGSQHAFLRDAQAIYTQNFSGLPDLQTEFSFTPSGWDTPLSITYDAPGPNYSMFGELGGDRNRLKMPRRCAVLIGRNGSGKSTLLSRLARVAFASPSERMKEDVRSIGTLEPEGLGFMRIITISYSAFDSFSLPGVVVSDLDQIAKDVERGEGRYIFCGLRDVVAEVRDQLEDLTVDAGQGRRLTQSDRRPTTKLKSLQQLANEFARLCERIVSLEREGWLDAALAPVLNDGSFGDLKEPNFVSLVGDDPYSAFLSWSTGHKICMHVIASLVAHAVPRSLILFDEPEAHLHPPLTAALMHGVRIALERSEAFAVIATHSPVVLQETLARHVRVIERRGSLTQISQPSGETFGENIGTLVYDTFGLTSSGTDYHELLDQLIALEDSVDDIDAYFTPSLSAQARAYVLANLGSGTDHKEGE